MKIRKTRQDQRTEYRYPVQVEDGKGGYRVVYHTIRPGDGEGEDIVTELHIQTMHSLDDSEVYYNTKNMRPQRSDSMKAEIAEWKRKYIADFVDKYGYEPHPFDVEEELKERFPSNWNLSLDWEMDDENTDGKSSVEAATAYVPESDNPVVERFHEVMAGMTELQQQALRLVELEGYTLKEAGEQMGTSPQNVKKHVDKAKKYIEENFYKNYF